jgi:GNAT superfamily N-acetyltransferase
MNIQIREFEEADREALRRLFMESRNASFVWAPAGAHSLDDFDRMTRGERILVATLEGVPIGFASLWEPESFLHNLFVHPVFQSRGAGGALLAACDQYFSGTPTLKCLKANDRAVRYYLSKGWQVKGDGESPDGTYFLMMHEAKPDSPAA